MADLAQDLKFAVRGLLKAPGFALVAILTLALGIGANSAIFSVVNGVILKQLPYAEPESLLYVNAAFPTMGFTDFWMSQPEFDEYSEWGDQLESLGAFTTGEVSVATATQPLRVRRVSATLDFFTTLGVQPVHGRLFSAEEDGPGGDAVALLSSELWQRAFGGDQGLLGESIDLNGTQTRVVGIMPPGFDIQDNGTEVWQPMQLDPANPRPRSNHFLLAVGRLAPGATVDSARAQLTSLHAQWRDRVPDGHVPNGDTHYLQARGLREEAVGDVRPALLLLLAAVGCVLLVACANVGNLLLARAESRQKEIAVRTALGASRGRLMRQFLTESVLLGLIGGVAGLLLGTWGLRVLLATSPDSLPRVAEITMDGSVLAFTLGVSIFTGLLFGMAPMLHMGIRNLSNSLREGGDRSTSGSARQRVRRSLVVLEIGLAVVLVVCAGLMIRSFAALQDVDPGFDPSGLLTFRVYLSSADYPDPGAQMAFFDQLTEKLGAVPGVISATAMNGLPPQRPVNANDTEFEGVERTEDGPPHNVDYYQWVTAGYFETMGIEVVEGRYFGTEDMGPGAQPVTVINQRLADVFYPGESPVGRRVRNCCGDSSPWLTIVGVVADVKQGGLETDTGTELYFYTPQVAAAVGFAPRTMNVVVRTSVPPATLATQAREAVWALDPGLPLADVQAMSSVLHSAVARPRFLTLLLGIFGAVALALAAIGTYGVMSYSVAERHRELGIRMALGAERSGVLRMVLAQGLKLAGAGLVMGVLAAVWVSRFMGTLLFGIGTTDLVTFLAVPALLLVVAIMACLIPARRATRVDPMVALRDG
jgi:predicted permease